MEKSAYARGRRWPRKIQKRQTGNPASGSLRFFGGLFFMAPKLITHRRKQLGGIFFTAARSEAREERRADYRRRNALVNRRLHRPPSFSRIRHSSREV